MIKVRKNMFETNSSSTHALVLNNQQYNEDVSEGDLLTLVNLPELECNISILTGEKDDVLYNGKHYNTYEGNFTNNDINGNGTYIFPDKENKLEIEQK